MVEPSRKCSIPLARNRKIFSPFAERDRIAVDCAAHADDRRAERRGGRMIKKAEQKTEMWNVKKQQKDENKTTNNMIPDCRVAKTNIVSLSVPVQLPPPLCANALSRIIYFAMKKLFVIRDVCGSVHAWLVTRIILYDRKSKSET